MIRTHRDEVRIGFVQSARPDGRLSTMNICCSVIVARFYATHRPSIRGEVLAYRTWPSGHEVHRHESLGAG